MAEDNSPQAQVEDGEIRPKTETEPDFSQKHPLENKWTLWYDGGTQGKPKQASWGSTLRAIYTFDSVEDFWCLYNNIKPPSWVNQGTDFHLFKQGIEPKWEDPRCEHGGKWTVLVPKGNKQLLDTYWLNTLLACIGEQFTEGDDICGIVVNVRAKQDRVSVWTKTASNEAAQISIGKQLKKYLDLQDSEKIGYLTHNDAKASNRARDRYQV
jgi:translation initiation factor 4E